MSIRNLSGILAFLALTLLPSQTSAENHKSAELGRVKAQSTKTSALADSMGSSALAQFPEKLESKYFIFYSTISRSRLQSYAHFADLFLDLVDRDFINLRAARKVSAVVLPTKAEFQRFLAQQMNVITPPEYGMYIGEKNLFITYDGSGLGTFSHEIMHFVVETMLPERPSWAIEGIPAFFEKFYGYEEDGKLQLEWGFQNPWRIQALGELIPKLKMINVIYGSNDTSEKRLLSVFLYQHGKLKTFLELIKKGDKNGFRTYVEAAFNKPMHEIEGEWQAYLNTIHAKRDQILKLPPSTYFQTAQEFAAFKIQITTQLAGSGL